MSQFPVSLLRSHLSCAPGGNTYLFPGQAGIFGLQSATWTTTPSHPPLFIPTVSPGGASHWDACSGHQEPYLVYLRAQSGYHLPVDRFQLKDADHLLWETHRMQMRPSHRRQLNTWLLQSHVILLKCSQKPHTLLREARAGPKAEQVVWKTSL